MGLGEVISWLFGWTYFVAWSVSFYPQALLNYQRKSVEGLSIDFLVYNIYSFLCYSIYNTLFYFSSAVNDEYQRRNDGEHNLVRFNDLVFSYHALVISGFTFYQTLIYQKAQTQTVSLFPKAFIGISLVVSLCVLLGANVLDFAYCLSTIKLICSAIKYIPQAWGNYKRKSTVGWSIHNIMLDFTGGVFSFLQLVLDASMVGNIASAFGNPVKLGLGLLSMGFDVLFFIQHYVLYRDRLELDELGCESYGIVYSRIPYPDIDADE